jgi:hypothetical protein
VTTRWFQILALAALATGCAHLAPKSFAEVDLGAREDVLSAVIETLKARDHRVTEVAPRRVATGWEIEREGVTTRRQRFIVTWDGEPPEPVTVYVRHEEQKMQLDQGAAPAWGSMRHDMGAQQELLDAITDRLLPPAPADE